MVYASNLHVGGGVQVATSIVEELSRIDFGQHRVTVWVSTEIDSNLRNLLINTSSFHEYSIIDHYGIKALWSRDRKRLSDYDGILVVFGPHYFGPMPATTVMGFAQPWIIYNNPDLYSNLSFLDRVALKAKYWLQRQIFITSDVLIVELDHVKAALIECQIKKFDDIFVSRNCLSSIFSSPDKWNSIEIPIKQKKYRLGFVGRNYSHKNTKIFPEVINILKFEYGLDVEVLVTFTEEEWSRCDKIFREMVINIGPISMSQLPFLYSNLDALFFPTLLECFSITPLEAMAMKCPVYASDRTFIRDVCGNNAHYFDPLNNQDIARVIAEGLSAPERDAELESIKNYAFDFSTPGQRANEYFDILVETVMKRTIRKPNHV